MDIYNTISMMTAVEQIFPVHTFLRTMFFPSSADEVLETETVLLDTKKGNRKAAPFVAPRVGGVTLNREGYVTSSITAPKIAPQRVLTLDDITSRAMGESIISTQTPAQRQAKIIGQDLKDLMNAIDRREEIMIRDLLFTGKVIVKGYIDHNDQNFVEQVIDYGKVPTIDTTGAEWDATTAPDILAKLREYRRDIIKASGVAPNVMVVGAKVADLLLNNEKIFKLLDVRNVNLGLIEPVSTASSGYIGRFASPQIDIYTYDEWYYDEEAEEDVPMIPDDMILLGNRNIGSMKYALVTQMENKDFKTYAGKKVPKVWADEANDRRMLRLTSRPVPVPNAFDAWAVAKVLK